MYEETLKRKPLRGFGAFLTIILLVFAILLLMLLVGMLQVFWHISYLQYILLAAVLASLVFLFRRYVKRYVYAISDDQVLIYRRIGGKQKLLYKFLVRDIVRFGKKDALGSLSGKKQFFMFKYIEQDTFFIVLIRDILALSPSGEFIQKLKEVYERTDR